MRSLRLLPLALAASAIFAACPSDEENGDKPITAGGFVDQILQVQKEKLVECSPAVSDVYLSMAQRSVSEVKSDLEKSVVAGRVVFHADKASECLQQLRAVPCDSFDISDSVEVAACVEALEPKVATGGDCYLSEECLGGFCDPDASCPGKCVAYAKVNESCLSLRCDSGLYCDSSTSTCLAQKADGADCWIDGECRDGLECRDGKCVAEVQPTPAALGESCVSVACARGLYCNAGTCAKGLAAGAECGADPFSALVECGNALACAGFSQPRSADGAIKGQCSTWMDLGGTCTPVPEGSIGISGCKIGLACQSGKCAIPPSSGVCAEGELLNVSCDPRSAYCDPNDQCVALKADAAACEDDEECKSGDCSDGKCFAGCHP